MNQLLQDAAEETGSMIDDGINWCVFHAYNVALAFGLSYGGWIFCNAWLSTNEWFWGAMDAGNPEVGIFRVIVTALTGYNDPWFCVFIVGLVVTFMIGILSTIGGIWDATFKGHTVILKGGLANAKALQTATHLSGFGISVAIGAVEDFFDAGRVGESFLFSALAGWGYLRPFVMCYQTPVRYVLNLIYGASIFAFAGPLVCHGLVGGVQSVHTALQQDSLWNTEWLWVAWMLLVLAMSIPLLAVYVQSAWHQGYGLGLWVGSWVPLRGWKLRWIYRMPAATVYHRLAS